MLLRVQMHPNSRIGELLPHEWKRCRAAGYEVPSGGFDSHRLHPCGKPLVPPSTAPEAGAG